MAEGMKRAEAYLVLEPRWSSYSWQGDKVLNGFTITRVVQNRPKTVPGDAVVMRIAIRVPDAAFKPISPSVTIEVPESMLITGDAITASAVEPSEKTQ